MCCLAYLVLIRRGSCQYTDLDKLVVVSRVTAAWLFCLSVLCFGYLLSAGIKYRMWGRGYMFLFLPLLVGYYKTSCILCSSLVWKMKTPPTECCVCFASLAQTCGWAMPSGSSSDCLHLDCVGEITKEELIEKSHVSSLHSWSCPLVYCIKPSYHTLSLLIYLSVKVCQ